MLVVSLGLFIALGVTAGLFLQSAFVAQASDAAMGIQVYKDKGGTVLSCDTGAIHRTCDVEVGQSFDVRVLATNPPTAGYTAYQTVLQYDSLVNIVDQPGTAEGKVPCNPAVESMPAANRYEFECKFVGGSSTYSGPLVNVFFVCKTAGLAQIDLIGGAGPNVSLYVSPSIFGSIVFLKSVGKGAKSVADAVLINCVQRSTPTVTATATPTNTLTPTRTHTPTITSTATITNTQTPTGTPTTTGTPPNTATATTTGTPPNTATATTTGTPPNTATATTTGTPPNTSTSTATATITNTPPNTATATNTSTPDGTATATTTGTPPNTATSTNTPPVSTPTSTSTPPSSTATPTNTAPAGSTITPTPTTTDTSPITVTPEVCKSVDSGSGDEEGEVAAGPETTCTPTPEPTNTPPVTPESTVLGSTVQPPGGPGAPILPDSGGGSPASPGGFLAIVGLLAAAGILLVQWARLRLAGVVTVVPARFGVLPDVITPPTFVPRR